MGDLTDVEINAALEHGRVKKQSESRATSVRYDRKAGHIIVELSNDCIFAFPPRIVQGLGSATHTELAEVELVGKGYGLHWEALDVDFSVPGLLAGLFGTKAYLARIAGQTRSPKKAAASRQNGRKGGRPSKRSAV
ncbi:DUF2442 domain-containing protein [Ruegeria sp.]|uniref:DUF2442 domain-containing protein n=1 Tax=Ruegeria sp. TaxID=1879320 RepID=UPI003B00BB0B